MTKKELMEWCSNRECPSHNCCSLCMYGKGRADYGNEILNYATELELENGCIDHTENECGEWVTMTIDYSKWCELWWFIEKHKKLEEQSNEQR